MRNFHMRGEHLLVASHMYMPPTRTGPTTETGTRTGSQTHDISFYRTMIQSTEPHWPGHNRASLKTSLSRALFGTCYPEGLLMEFIILYK